MDMNPYPLVRPLLFRLPPECVHVLSLWLLRSLDSLFQKTDHEPPTVGPIELMGLKFPNRVGLAAGLDKSGNTVDGLRRLGFGFVEVGTFTPKPQPGNPRPRLFRLPSLRALINRMDFPNPGIEAALENLKKVRYPGILGVNIVKNSATRNEDAIADYIRCFEAFSPVADYITVNVSCPNTPNLRALQKVESLEPLLQSLKDAQAKLRESSDRYVPLVVKVSPDLDDEDIGAMARLFKASKIDGLIATNTTTKRPEHLRHARIDEIGGLSGAPLKERSPIVVARFRDLLGPDFPIIGSGGIMSGEDAAKMLAAGADLIQLYTGLVYEGPHLIKACLDALNKKDCQNTLAYS